ncbi:MAG: hypothetical protein QNJ97_19330 [Myxococcota bacterium]|nr:hypothetical protein [Myxococcota bacterium]
MKRRGTLLGLLAAMVVFTAAEVQATAWGWSLMDTSNNIDVAANHAEVYRVRIDGRVFRHYEDGYWFDITDDLPYPYARRICADSNGDPWVVGHTGAVYKGDVTGNWETISTSPPAQDIGCGGGQVFMTRQSTSQYGGSVMKRVGNNWIWISGLATDISVDMDGKPWVVNGEGKVFYGNGDGGWSHMNRAWINSQWDYDYRAIDVAGYQYVFGFSIEEDTEDIYTLYDTTYWYRFYPTTRDPVERIAISSSKEVWIVVATGRIYRHILPWWW